MVAYSSVNCFFSLFGTRLNLNQRHASLFSKSYTGVTAFAIRQEQKEPRFVWERDTPWPGEHSLCPLPSLQSMADVVGRF